MLYKIVDVRRDYKSRITGYYSYAAETVCSEVRYFKTKKAFAPKPFADKGYLLLTFDNIENICSFIKKHSSVGFLNKTIKIFEVEVDFQKTKLPVMKHHRYPPNSWREFYVASSKWPKGSIMANGVILKKDVTNEAINILEHKTNMQSNPRKKEILLG